MKDSAGLGVADTRSCRRLPFTTRARDVFVRGVVFFLGGAQGEIVEMQVKSDNLATLENVFFFFLEKATNILEFTVISGVSITVFRIVKAMFLKFRQNRCFH